MDLGLSRLHDLCLEGRELRQDLRLAWRRHHSAALVLPDRLRHPRRGGTERGDRASNHPGRRTVLGRSKTAVTAVRAEAGPRPPPLPRPAPPPLSIKPAPRAPTPPPNNTCLAPPTP